MRVAFFPPLSTLIENPYWAILSESLSEFNVEIINNTPIIFSTRWLLRHYSKIDIIHLQFIRPFYISGKSRKLRLIHVIIFTLNLLLIRYFGIQLIMTVHDPEPPLEVNPKWVDTLAHWIAVNLSNKVIVHCAEAENLVNRKFNRKRKIFIVDHPNYINSYPNSITKKEARKKLGLDESKLVFGFVGGIRKNKGVEQLIYAFKALRQIDSQLIIAGKTSKSSIDYLAELKKISEGDDRIFFFPNFIAPEEIQIYLNAVDIMVLPFSKILTSGSTILSLSFKKPVIVPKTGCLPELIKSQYGWLYEPDDLSSLIGAMESAAGSSHEAVGQAAFEMITSCTPSKFAKQTYDVYFN